MLSKVCGAAALSDQSSRLHPRIPQAVVLVLCIPPWSITAAAAAAGSTPTTNCRRHALPTSGGCKPHTVLRARRVSDMIVTLLRRPHLGGAGQAQRAAAGEREAGGGHGACQDGAEGVHHPVPRGLQRLVQCHHPPPRHAGAAPSLLHCMLRGLHACTCKAAPPAARMAQPVH